MELALASAREQEAADATACAAFFNHPETEVSHQSATMPGRPPEWLAQNEKSEELSDV